MCVCVPNGGWTKSGCYYAEDGTWSVAWRVHDAQFWGVPQRRKRIALVADFGGLSAPEALFERKGLSRDSEPRGTAREETAGETGKSVESAISFQERAGGPGGGKGILIQGEKTGALSTLNNQMVFSAERAVAYSFDSLASNSMKSKNPNSGCRQVEVAKTLDCFDPNPRKNQGGIAVVQIGCDVYNQEITGEVAASLTASCAAPNHSGPKVIAINGDVAGTLDANYYKGCGERQGVEREVVCVGNGQANQSVSDKAAALNTMHDQQAVLCFQNTGQGWWNESDVGATIRTPCGGGAVKANLVAAVDCRNGVENSDINGTLQAKSTGGIGVNFQNVCRIGSLVRRLTPLECERLQGYPDGWTDIGDWMDSNSKKHKAADSPRYKALGNSIALPFWFWLLRRISAQYERPATLGSLFDGIGGFPLCWERCNGQGTALWASEIEEFPIAVTKKHFGDDEAGIEGDIQKYL